MAFSIAHRLIALLCLAAFGFGQAAFLSTGVRCTDASGASRIEYVCLKSAHGSCGDLAQDQGVSHEDAGHDADTSVPDPCKDEPLKPQAAAKTILTGPSLEQVFVAAVAEIRWDHWRPDANVLFQEMRPELDHDRPPDTLACLSSVILVV